jgi:hypothetical protein
VKALIKIFDWYKVVDLPDAPEISYYSAVLGVMTKKSVGHMTPDKVAVLIDTRIAVLCGLMPDAVPGMRRPATVLADFVKMEEPIGSFTVYEFKHLSGLSTEHAE